MGKMKQCSQFRDEGEFEWNFRIGKLKCFLVFFTSLISTMSFENWKEICLSERLI